MNRFIRPAAIAAALIAGTYGVLLIAAAAAPAPTRTDEASQSTIVANRLKADATLLAHPGARPKEEPQSP